MCDEQNAVSCVNLEAGTRQACCPRLTRCVSDRRMSEENVRCEIAYSDLTQLAATAAASSSLFPTQATISTSSGTSSTSHSSTASGSMTTAAPSPHTSEEAVPPGISGGAIAGIVIGALVALGLCATVTYVVVRRRLAAKYGNQTESPSDPPGSSSNVGYSTGAYVKDAPKSHPPAQAEMAELPSLATGLYELDGNNGSRP